MDDSKSIKEKRAALGLTQKEFADALGLGKYGERTLRRWENGESAPSSLEYQMIMNFALHTPYISESGNRFRYIDLFAGIGGIRIPFQELGGKCVFSSEWDKFSAKTYRVNFGEIPAGDITQIPAGDIPDFDILLAGFPCQPFSMAGLHKGFSDTRGTLFFEIERILKEKRPKAFLLENVKQLKGHDHGRTFNIMIEHLLALNYHVDAKVLNAKDFGVPQNRERIYIVGFNRDLLNVPDDYAFPYPKPVGYDTKVGDILEKEPVDDKYTVSDKMWVGLQRRKTNNRNNGKGFGFSLVDADTPYTGTLVARYYKDGQEVLVRQQHKNPRKLTPRECARLQGFPDSFIIPVSDTQAYRQFGNSVAVPVIRAVATNLLHEMDTLKQ